MIVKTEIVKTLCSMCLKEVNGTIECAWEFSASCLTARLKKIAQDKIKK